MRTLIAAALLVSTVAGLAAAPCGSAGARDAPPANKRKAKASAKRHATRLPASKRASTNCPVGCKCRCARHDNGCPCTTGTPCGDHEACHCCVAARPKDEPPVMQNFGVELDRLQAGQRYAINGRPITATEARSRLVAAASGTVPDDTAKARLTVIGSPVQTASVVKDLAEHPELAPWRDRLLVQAYAPDHWAVARSGFVTTGTPTIYLQGPDGTVLHRQDDYAGGAVALTDALRKADPLYRPDRDRDRRLPDLFPSLPRVPWSAGVLAAAAAILLLPRRSKP